jgi:hypothetical protein
MFTVLAHDGRVLFRTRDYGAALQAANVVGIAQDGKLQSRTLSFDYLDPATRAAIHNNHEKNLEKIYAAHPTWMTDIPDAGTQFGQLQKAASGLQTALKDVNEHLRFINEGSNLIARDAFVESEHPRDKDGKLAEVGGGSGAARGRKMGSGKGAAFGGLYDTTGETPEARHQNTVMKVLAEKKIPKGIHYRRLVAQLIKEAPDYGTKEETVNQLKDKFTGALLKAREHLSKKEGANAKKDLEHVESLLTKLGVETSTFKGKGPTPENFSTKKADVYLDEETFGPEALLQNWETKRKAKDIQRHAAAVAEKLGYTNVISIRGDEHEFVLNGAKRYTAGLCYIKQTGHVELFASPLTGTESDNYVIAHEIMHHKFEHARNAIREEREKMMKDPEVWPENVPYWQQGMKPDGSLKEPFDKKYPLYQMWWNVFDSKSSDTWRDTDGCTSYSRDWWREYSDGKASLDSAVHETLAEMAAEEIKHGTLPIAQRFSQEGNFDLRPAEIKKRKEGGKQWYDLYNAVNKVFSESKTSFMEQYKRGDPTSYERYVLNKPKGG